MYKTFLWLHIDPLHGVSTDFSAALQPSMITNTFFLKYIWHCPWLLIQWSRLKRNVMRRNLLPNWADFLIQLHKYVYVIYVVVILREVVSLRHSLEWFKKWVKVDDTYEVPKCAKAWDVIFFAPLHDLSVPYVIRGNKNDYGEPSIKLLIKFRKSLKTHPQRSSKYKLPSKF